jgi:hypothetical protein
MLCWCPFADCGRNASGERFELDSGAQAVTLMMRSGAGAPEVALPLYLTAKSDDVLGNAHDPKPGLCLLISSSAMPF